MKRLLIRVKYKTALVLLILLATDAFAQSKLQLLFEEVGNALMQAKSQHAQVLCEERYDQAVEYYDLAKKYQQNEEESAYVVEALEYSINEITMLNENIDEKQNFFYEPLQARERAMEKNAEKNSEYFFLKAEQNLTNAIGYYESGDLQDARNELISIQEFYNKANDYSTLANNLQYNWLPYNNANKIASSKYAPNQYAEGMDHFYSALNLINDGIELPEIETEIISAEEKFLAAENEAVKFISKFPRIVSARDKAITAGAEQLVFAPWQTAETSLINFSKNQNNDEFADIEDINNVVELYEVAESDAYKYQFLSVAKKKIQEAENIDAGNFTPASFENSELYLKEASDLIETDNNRVSKITQLADESIMESNKAILISKIIQSVEAGETTWEDVLLSWSSVRPKAGRVLRETTYKKPEPKQKKEEKEYVPEPIETPYISVYLDVFTPEEAELIEEDDQLTIHLTGLNFEPISTKLEFKHMELLDKVINKLKQYPNSRISIIGNTDNIGLKADNQKISENRAKNVYDYLVKKSDISPGRISHSGDGELNPITDNRTAEGRQKNRRVDIIVNY